MRTEGLSLAGINAALCHFDLVKDTSLKWYDTSATAKRGFYGGCGASLFYQLHAAYVISVVSGLFDHSDQLEVTGKIYMASQLARGPCDITGLPHIN